MSSKRIEFLDGLRTVSVLIVVFWHVLACSLVTGNIYVAQIIKYIPSGDLGVNIFFVISGFIITFLLLLEEEKNNTICLKKFFLRRFFRIIPLTFIFIAVVFLLYFLIDRSYSLKTFVPGLTFTTRLCFTHDGYWELAHLWSLAVEQQFYLFWPFIMKYVLSFKRREQLLVLFILISLSYRVIERYIPFLPRIPLVVHYDFLSVGCLVAMIYKSGKSFLIFSSRGRLFLWGLILVTDVVGRQNNNYLIESFLLSIQALSIGLTLVSYLNNPKGIDCQIFSTKLFSIVGISSFSIYLWQELFTGPYPHLWNIFPLNIFFSIIAGICSYYFIERFFLKVKDKFKIS